MSDTVFVKEKLDALIVGDLLKTEGIMPGVCDEPLEWYFVEKYEVSKKPEDTFYVFETAYYGIFFGYVMVYFDGDGVPHVSRRLYKLDAATAVPV